MGLSHDSFRFSRVYAASLSNSDCYVQTTSGVSRVRCSNSSNCASPQFYLQARSVGTLSELFLRPFRGSGGNCRLIDSCSLERSQKPALEHQTDQRSLGGRPAGTPNSTIFGPTGRIDLNKRSYRQFRRCRRSRQAPGQWQRCAAPLAESSRRNVSGEKRAGIGHFRKCDNRVPIRVCRDTR